MRNKVEVLRERVDALESQQGELVQAEREAGEREKQLRAHNAVLRTLSLSGALEKDDVVTARREIAEAAAQALDVERVGVWLFDRQYKRLRCVELYRQSSRKHQCDIPTLSAKDFPRYFEALAENRSLAAVDAQHDPRTREFNDVYLKPNGITSMLDAPVRIDGKLAGVICHEHVGPIRQWSVDEETFAGSMADFVALTLQAGQRKQAERAAERQRAYLRHIIDVDPNLVFIKDKHSRFMMVNQAVADVLGGTPEALVGRSVAEFATKPEEIAHFRDFDAQEILPGEGPVVSEEKFTTPEGDVRWYHSMKMPIAPLEGLEQNVLCIAVDITSRKNDAQRLATMVRELDHRVKNNLFAVLVMAEQTAAEASSVEAFLPVFTGRVRAMAAVHEVLAHCYWQEADLNELVQRLLEQAGPSGAQRVSIEGETVGLPSTIAPALGTVIHELASNAQRHGALSTEGGGVQLRWHMKDGDLHLHWCEYGGPPVREPEQRGFGLDLVEQTVSHQLRGRASLQFDREGFTCSLQFPCPPLQQRFE